MTLVAALLLFRPPTTLQQAQFRLYDQMVTGRLTRAQSPVPVLVGVDEDSLAAYGQWPWPRYRLAMLVERLQALGAEVVAMDFLMPEPDRSSPEVIEFERQRDSGRFIARASSTTPRDSNSERLSAAMRRGSTILGYYLDFSGTHQTPPPSAEMVVVSTPGSTAGWPRPKGTIRSLPTLTQAASAEGFINSGYDIDGTLRRVPLLMTHEGKIRASLSLSALMLAASDRMVSVTKNGADTVVRWNDRQIPLDAAGNLLLDFRSGQPAFPYHSARSILESEFSSQSLRGKIVLVGAWAVGLGDTHLTPSGKAMHGLEVHATIIDNILGGTFISRPSWAEGVELLAILVLGIASTLLLSRSGYILSLVATVVLTAGSYVAARQLLVIQGLHVSPLLPMLTLVAITSVLGLLKYGIEARKLKHRTRELIDAQDTVIVGMSVLAETRDRDTGGHILRTRRYVEILARQLSKMKKYAYLDETSIQLLAKSAALHDIGKVGIPDSILQKPESLTAAEFEIMKRHTLIGAEALARILKGTRRPEQHVFLNYAKEMIISHHEWWDGRGYPYGLKGEEIPLAGRLMAVADVYDALISRRGYKASLSHEQAREEIARKSGAQFDSDIVDAFLLTGEEFYKTSQAISDRVEPAEAAPASPLQSAGGI